MRSTCSIVTIIVNFEEQDSAMKALERLFIFNTPKRQYQIPEKIEVVI